MLLFPETSSEQAPSFRGTTHYTEGKRIKAILLWQQQADVRERQNKNDKTFSQGPQVFCESPASLLQVTDMSAILSLNFLFHYQQPLEFLEVKWVRGDIEMSIRKSLCLHENETPKYNNLWDVDQVLRGNIQTGILY